MSWKPWRWARRGTVTWRRANQAFVGTFAGVLAAVYAFVLLLDPYGVVPFSLPFERPLTTTQRQMYPQILRTGRYDSIVVGTSTSKFLDPAALGAALGGKFATFAMAQATAREQVAIIGNFGRTVAVPGTVLVGVDHEWCYRSAAALVREREFPSWAYDDNRWNDLLYLLNAPTLEAALHAAGHLAGRYPAKLRADGFEGGSPPEAAYDLARTREMIAAGEPRAVSDAVAAAETAADADGFEALAWLDGALAALPDATRRILVFPPVHVRALPAPGSRGEARERECKWEVAAIAHRRGAVVIDWRLKSSLTAEDGNFWDLVHYRLGVGYRLIGDLGRMVEEGREPGDGSARILVR